MLERTGNKERRLGDVFTLDRRALPRLAVDPAFQRPGLGSVSDSPRERPGALDDEQPG
jgi:hypothetical protein